MTFAKVLDRIMILVAAITLAIAIGEVQARAQIPGAYGLPLPWITLHYPQYPGCELVRVCILSTDYDWTYFGLDVLFYTVVGYSLFLIYTKTNARKTTGDDESTNREETGARS